MSINAPPRGNKADFLHAIEVLTAISAGGGYEHRPLGEIRAAHVACPYETWERIFGPPEERSVCHSPTRLALHTWRHTCSDGPVQCVGHIDKRPDGDWVILARVCLF
jgi:hypothetical protein